MTNLSEDERAVAAGFSAAGCWVGLHVVDLSSGAEFGIEPDAPILLASVFKIQVALEFFALVDAGRINSAERLTVEPAMFTAGPTGISRFQDAVELSLRDLCELMLTISDNTATDLLIQGVGLEAINARSARCGLQATVIESDLKTLFDGLAADLGFRSFAELDAARSGALGDTAMARSNDAARIDASAAFDPARTNRSTARDMTRLLSAIWRDEAASPAACANVRAVMGRQVSTRLGRALPEGASIAAKTGSLTGRVRTEVGVVTHADGRAFAAAVFTRAYRPFAGVTAIERAMATGCAAAIASLRRRP
jgi:beta-lactamase class A